MFDQSLADQSASEIATSVRGKEFVLVRRGYDQDQVRRFLVETARAVEQLETLRLQAQREQEVLKGEVELLRAELESAREGSSADGDPFEQTGIRVAEILRSVNEDVAAMRREAEEATVRAKSDARSQAHTFLHEAMEDLASGGDLLLQEMEEARQRVADILDRLRTSIDEKAAMVEPASDEAGETPVAEQEALVEEPTDLDDATEQDLAVEPLPYEPSQNGDAEHYEAEYSAPVRAEEPPYAEAPYETSSNGEAEQYEVPAYDEDEPVHDESPVAEEPVDTQEPADVEPVPYELALDGEVEHAEHSAYDEPVPFETDDEPVQDEASHVDPVEPEPVGYAEPVQPEPPVDDEPVLSESVEEEPAVSEPVPDEGDDREPILSFVVGSNPDVVSPPPSPTEPDPNSP
jgi:DivIVA domain-containing protein